MKKDGKKEEISSTMRNVIRCIHRSLDGHSSIIQWKKVSVSSIHYRKLPFIFILDSHINFADLSRNQWGQNILKIFGIDSCSSEFFF